MQMADECVISIQREVEISEGLDPNSSACIFRIPRPLRSVRPTFFTPQMVTIGPYHCRLQWQEDPSETQFSEMKSYKIMAVKAILKNVKDDFSRLVETISKKEEQVRSYYDRGLASEGCSPESLAHTLALDAAFVVCILHSFHNEQASSEEIPCNFARIYQHRFSRPVRKSIIQDFLLLENQIPLFLLRDIMIGMDSTCSSEEVANRRLESFIGEMARRVLPFRVSDTNITGSVEGLGSRGKHILDCLYAIVTHSSRKGKGSKAEKHILDCLYEIVTCKGSGAETQQQKQDVEVHPTRVPSATELHDAGVEFEGHDGSLAEVQFERRMLRRPKLRIPRIHVGDSTEKVFRNLLAYESLAVDERKEEGEEKENVHVVSYLHFMNDLINTEHDVSVLVNHGVITQSLGNNAHVATMWNELSINTERVFSCPYSQAAHAASRHHDLKINSLLVEFFRTYFSRPWLLLSVASGAALLVLTFLNMWYTILIYWNT